jgi:outer membrane protein OmpA-like peptidoglycan-associated protein
MILRLVAIAATFILQPWPVVAQGADCLPFGRMPNYVPQHKEAQPRNYDGMEVRIKKGDDYETQFVTGRACRQTYAVRDGARMASDLEIQKNYLSQAAKIGGQQTYSDDRDLYVRAMPQGKETWLHVYSQEDEIRVAVIEVQPFKPTLTTPSGADHRLFGHMPNYSGKAEKRNFDKFTFRHADGEDVREIEVQGARHFVTYTPRPRATHSSDLDVRENYRWAIEAYGGQVLHSDDQTLSGRADVNGQTVWVHVYSQEDEIRLNIIEEKPFEASIKAPVASALKAALDKDGRVALYVNFDFAKSVLQPDAAPVIAQVVKLLQDNPALKLSVEGHTDNVGGQDYNMKLSAARAAAVVEAVKAQGVGGDRLASRGFGAEKPIADNGSGEGRSKNRRVELVKR